MLLNYTTSTTSVPPFWIRLVRYLVSSVVNEQGGLTWIEEQFDHFWEIHHFTSQIFVILGVYGLTITKCKINWDMHLLRPVTEEAILLLLRVLRQPEHQLLLDQVPKPPPSIGTRQQITNHYLPNQTVMLERAKWKTTKLFEDGNHLLTYHKSIGSHNIEHCDS